MSSEKLEISTFNIVERLKVLMGEKTQKAFAEWLDVHPSKINEYLSEKTRPGIDFLVKLSTLGVNTDWFLTGNGPVYQGLSDDTLPPEAQVFLKELMDEGIKPENLPELLKLIKQLIDQQRNVEASKEELRLAFRVFKEGFEQKKRNK